MSENIDIIVAIKTVQELPKLEPSLGFLSRSKFCEKNRETIQENSTCHFVVNSADRQGICANLIMIRTDPRTIGGIRPKVACRIFGVDDMMA